MNMRNVTVSNIIFLFLSLLFYTAPTLCMFHETPKERTFRFFSTYIITSKAKKPNDLISILYSLLHSKRHISIDRRMNILAEVLTDNPTSLFLRNEQHKTALMLVEDAFDSLYTMSQRKEPYKIICRNNDYYGIYLVLKTAQERWNDVEQLLIDPRCTFVKIIQDDSQILEKLVHIINYFLNHGMSPEQLTTYFEASDINLNQFYGRNGITPLMYAAYNGLRTTIEFLLRAGASRENKDLTSLMNTALHYAVQGGHTGTARLLHMHGIENVPNARNVRPSTLSLELANTQDETITERMLELLVPKSIIGCNQPTYQDESIEQYWYITRIINRQLPSDMAITILEYTAPQYKPEEIILATSYHGLEALLARIIWYLEYKDPSIAYNCPIINNLFVMLVTELKKYVSIGTSALILSYIGRQFDIESVQELGNESSAASQFLIMGPYLQYEAIQKILQPEDQSNTILAMMGRWIGKLTRQQYHYRAYDLQCLAEQRDVPWIQQNCNTMLASFYKNNRGIDVADTDGTTSYDIAIRQGSGQIARVLRAAGSQHPSIDSNDHETEQAFKTAHEIVEVAPQLATSGPTVLGIVMSYLMYKQHYRSMPQNI